MNEDLPILGKIAALWADVIVVEMRKYDPNPLLKFFDPETKKAAFVKISKEQAKELIKMLRDAIGETEREEIREVEVDGKAEEAYSLFVADRKEEEVE